MKKFTKLFLSCAAVAAVTAAVATSAMAADPVTLKGGLAGSTYEDGKLTIAAPADMDKAKPATLLVVPGDGTTVDANTVEGIDQSAAGVAFDKTGLKTAPAEGKYKVILGYYDTTGEFKKASSNLFGAGVTVGDVDLNGDITMVDALTIAQYKANSTQYPLSDEQLLAADSDGNEDITMLDALCIAYYKAGGADNLAKAGHVGEEI